MARQFMGGDFRAIRSIRMTVTDPDKTAALLSLVGGFQAAQIAQTSGVVDLTAPLPEGVIDLSSDSPDYSALFVEASQEPAGEPQEDETQNSPAETGEAAQPEQEAENEDAEPQPAPKVQADDSDYDPIAAVLG